MKHVVQFDVQHPPYNAGETAGFPDDIAADLIRRGRAHAYTPACADVTVPCAAAPASEAAMTSTELGHALEDNARQRQPRGTAAGRKEKGA